MNGPTTGSNSGWEKQITEQNDHWGGTSSLSMKLPTTGAGQVDVTMLAQITAVAVAIIQANASPDRRNGGLGRGRKGSGDAKSFSDFQLI